MAWLRSQRQPAPRSSHCLARIRAIGQWLRPAPDPDAMPSLNRRAVLASVVAVSASRLFPPALAQQAPAPPAAATPVFEQADVVKRAHELASAPFDATIPPLPESI